MKEFLRVQSTVKKLQGNIEKLSKQLESHEKFKVPLSTNHQIVKPFTPKNSVDVLHRQTHVKNQTSVLKTHWQQLDAECELRCQGSEIETCTSETKNRRRKTMANTKKQLKPLDTQEMSDRLKSMLNPWQIRGMEILQSQVDHQADYENIAMSEYSWISWITRKELNIILIQMMGWLCTPNVHSIH